MLAGKVVVVTGAAGAIGRAACEAACAAGAITVVTDIDLAAAKSVAASLPGSAALLLDVCDPTGVAAALAEVQERWGRVDGLIHAAYPRSPNYGRSLEDVEYADFCVFLDRHLGGAFLVAQRFAAAMASSEGGSIVLLSSIYGLHAPDFSQYDGTDMTMPVEYAAAKAGIVGLTGYLAAYYKERGVRTNSVAPGGIRAGQPESFQRRYDARGGSRGLLEAQDVAGALVFLLSDAARYVTGQAIVVDDGWSL